MIFDGFILMVVGMLVVYFFLIIMNTIIITPAIKTTKLSHKGLLGD
ncbi:hypothetical protein Clim_0805 [Chlorobium limicola DSM 245]|uniref:Uncharacterized protein n=1 Tax=Chlorobium limicola (strain DSM 245 / NBRC 103803 / 6330) TaxID=290315 RepID=B3EI55_CHLL2|nr:hypothetical protein Clim_0805 [Chlorobium limicola DSM 245]